MIKLLQTLMLILGIFSIPNVFANGIPAKRNRNLVRPTLEEKRDRLRISPATLTLRITPPSIYFDHEGHFLSQLYRKIPEHFPDFRHKPLRRKLHATTLLQHDIEFEDFSEIVKKLSRITPEEIKEAGLDKPVVILDPNTIEVDKFGRHDDFLVIRAHQDFAEYNVRLYNLLIEKVPELQVHMNESHEEAEKLAAPLRADEVHFSVLQWGGKSGQANANRFGFYESIKNRFFNMINGILDLGIKNGSPYEPIIFDPSRTPVEFTMSGGAGPVTLFSFSIDKEKGIIFPEIMKWPLKNKGPNNVRLVEVATKEILLDKEISSGRAPAQWTPKSRNFEAISWGDFLDRVSPEVDRLIKITDSPTENPSTLPAPVRVVTTNREQKTEPFSLVVTSQSHPMLDPLKGADVFVNAREMGLKSTPNVQLGLAIYASSVRSDVKYPGDYDLLLNSVVSIPDTVKTFEEAKAFAIEQFFQTVVGQLKDLVVEGKAAISEFRVGSDATMGYTKANDLTGYEENPYLIQKNVFENSYVDSRGKKWTIQELLALEDFAKAKLDLYLGNERFEISLQFNMAMAWKDQIFSLQRNALKGVGSLLRTAVYENYNSYGIGFSIKEAVEAYRSQKGPILPSAIKELYKHGYTHLGEDELYKASHRVPTWKSKFLKKIYNFILLNHRSPVRLDQIFYMETRKLQMRVFGTTAPPIETILDEIYEAINHKALAPLNAMRRAVNDLAEFNERRQLFEEKGIEYRIQELLAIFEIIEAEVLNHIHVSSNDKAHLRKFIQRAKAWTIEMSHLPSENKVTEAHRAENLSFFEAWESLMFEMESAVASTNRTKALSLPTRHFITILTDYSPLLYLDYIQSRGLVDSYSYNWELARMGVPDDAATKNKVQKLIGDMGRISRPEYLLRLEEILSPKTSNGNFEKSTNEESTRALKSIITREWKDSPASIPMCSLLFKGI